MQRRMAVRAARPEDAAEVVALLGDARLETAFAPDEFVVAEADGRVVACARLKPLAGGGHEIASVAVVPELRGQGVGGRVVRQALDRASGRVLALALAPGFFECMGFARLDDVPDALREKAERTCGESAFVPMAWTAGTEAVRARYGRIAVDVQEAEGAACCGLSCGCATDTYSADELAALPPAAHLGLGTGNPVREAAPQPGETTVDLGSGAGVDVFLAARAVGPEGRAVGIDFSPEMLSLARENARRGGFANVAFHEASIEKLPLGDGVADVVMSNCVVNLSADRRRSSARRSACSVREAASP